MKGYTQTKMSKPFSRLLREAKELHMPRQNSMKIKQELEKAFLEHNATISSSFFEIIPLCRESFNSLKKK